MSNRISSGDYPTESYDWDYAEPGPSRPKVLWGRVAILGVVLLAAFWIGRSTAPGGGVSEEDFNNLLGQFQATQSELADAEQQIRDLQPTPEETGGQGNAGGGGGNGDDEADIGEDNVIYTVQPGDVLVNIAEACYGDPSLDTEIIGANEGLDPSALAAGQQLIIPPNPNTAEAPTC